MTFLRSLNLFLTMVRSLYWLISSPNYWGFILPFDILHVLHVTLTNRYQIISKHSNEILYFHKPNKSKSSFRSNLLMSHRVILLNWRVWYGWTFLTNSLVILTNYNENLSCISITGKHTRFPEFLSTWWHSLLISFLYVLRSKL